MKKNVALILSILFLLTSFGGEAFAAVIPDKNIYDEINAANEAMLNEMIRSKRVEYIEWEKKHEEKAEVLARLLDGKTADYSLREKDYNSAVDVLEESVSNIIYSRTENYPDSNMVGEISDAELLARNIRLLFDVLAWNINCDADFDYRVFMASPDNLSVGQKFFVDYAKFQKELLKKGTTETRIENDVTILECSVDNACATIRVQVDRCDLYENGLVGHSWNEYKLTFNYIKGAWLISDISSNILLESEYRNSGGVDNASFWEMPEVYTEDVSWEQQGTVTEPTSDIALANTRSSIFYDRSKVVWYASEYAQSYNNNFPNWISSGNDCMNFASQCVWYGFGGVNSSTYINNFSSPMVASGAKAWHSSKVNGTSNSWSSISYFTSMIRTTGEGLCGSYYSGVNFAQPGDLVLISRDNENWGHAYVVVAVTGTYGNRTDSDVYVSAHTDPCNGEQLYLVAPRYYKRSIIVSYV